MHCRIVPLKLVYFVNQYHPNKFNKKEKNRKQYIFAIKYSVWLTTLSFLTATFDSPSLPLKWRCLGILEDNMDATEFLPEDWGLFLFFWIVIYSFHASSFSKTEKIRYIWRTMALFCFSLLFHVFRGLFCFPLDIHMDIVPIFLNAFL